MPHEVSIFIKGTSSFFTCVENKLQVTEEVTNKECTQEQSRQSHKVFLGDG
jgi:hypothetical protein